MKHQMMELDLGAVIHAAFGGWFGLHVSPTTTVFTPAANV